jgi:hypothetical protein
MLLKKRESGELVKISELENLLSPTEDTVTGQIQGGQAEQPPSSFKKEDLIFPSGEDLPRCWLDAEYRMKSSPE